MAAANESEVIRDKAVMRAWSRRRRTEGKTVALVPTAASTDPVAMVVSIYVNPSQFAPSEDLAAYPFDLAGDLRKLASTGAIAAVFFPQDLYIRGATTTGRRADTSGGTVSCLEAAGDGHETWIRVERLEKGLCGSSRPMFFRGR